MKKKQMSLPVSACIRLLYTCVDYPSGIAANSWVLQFTRNNVEPWYFLPGTLKMKHNPNTITHISHIGTVSTTVEVFTYQYNKEGYPVSLHYKHGTEPA